MTTFQASPVHIDFAHDTMTSDQYEKYELLSFIPFYGTITQGDGGRNAHYGETHNRILDRQAGRRNIGDAVHHGPRLDQSGQVSSLPLRRQMEGQEKRDGGLAKEPAKYVTIPKNTFGPPENGKLNGDP